MSISVMADVTLTDRHMLTNKARKAGMKATGFRAAVNSGAKVPHATGSVGLIDNSGLKYFINTNITFSTTSSASAARSEASYTHAVNADTLNGGFAASTLNDAYDGYDTLCLSLNNTVANCQTGNANFVIYNKLGPATSECPGAGAINRQIVFPVQTTGALQVHRTVFVPDSDSFSRTCNYFKNTGGSPLTVTAVIANNLGSDNGTFITGTSLGGAPPLSVTNPAVQWIASFQYWGSPSPTKSSDVRLAHVFGGPSGSIPLAGINFVNGDDNPYWGWTFTVQPGQTRVIMTFGVGQPTRAAAAAKAAALVALPPNSTQCMTFGELQQVANFAVNTGGQGAPTLSPLGLAIAAAALGLAGIFVMRMRT